MPLNIHCYSARHKMHVINENTLQTQLLFLLKEKKNYEVILQKANIYLCTKEFRCLRSRIK